MENQLIYIYHAYFPSAYLISMYRTGAPTGSIDLKRLPLNGFNLSNPFQRSQFWDIMGYIFAYIVSGEASIGYLQQTMEVPMVFPLATILK
jgi:hypothetical protein